MGCFTTKYKVRVDELTLQLNGKFTTFKKGDIIYRDHVSSFSGQKDEVFDYGGWQIEIIRLY